MDIKIANFLNYFSNIIKSTSNLFKFRNYTNNKVNRKIDNLFENDKCMNIKKTIKCEE